MIRKNVADATVALAEAMVSGRRVQIDPNDVQAAE
jgi:hypothetical protein